MVTDGAAGAQDQPASGPDRPPPNGQAGPKAHDRPGGRGRVRREIEVGKEKIAGSWAGYLWHRLVAVDFMNQAIMVAGTLLLCAFPFFLIVAALEGRSAVQGMTRHLGLNQQASADVGHLIAPTGTTAAAVTGLAYVAFIFCGICASAAVQGTYERVFELPSGGSLNMIRQLIWLGLVLGFGFLTGWGGPWARRGGPVLLWIVGLVLFTGFWWLTIRLLLGGRVSWRRLFPCAVATGLFWVGMLLVFSFIFSGIVISEDQKYGPVGTVFALMSWMIAIGVVIILGAVTGLVWQERGMSFRAAFRKVRRAR